MSAKKSAAPRQLADEILDGLEELTRWAGGEKTGVRSYTVEASPAGPGTRRTRIRLPGGGTAVVTLTLPAAADPAAERRRVARIRRAVLKAVADD